jgi:hypothetical protein
MENSKGTLKETEPHPMSYSAMDFFKSLPIERLMLAREAMASCAIEGNRVGEVCGETLDRLFKGQPVSDRYLMGLCWLLQEMVNKNQI